MLSVDQLDPSFGDGGVAGVPLPAAVTVSYGRGMARLADGSLVTGVAGGTGRLQVARFTAAGAPVTTFGAGGVASLGAPGAGGSQIVATDVAAAPGGKVVVAGTRGSDGLAVARYLDDGTPDPTFGTGGLVTTNLAYSAAPLDTYDVANAVAVQPDGKVLVGGRDGAYWALVRYTAAGALDPTFGDGGAVRFDQLDVRSSGTEGAGVQGIAVAADGRIVVAGRNFTPNLGDGTLVVRLTADGAPDATFDGDGKRPLYQTTGGGSQPSAGGVAVRPDGRVLVGGSEAAGNPVVYALTAAGSPDPTFDADGKAVVTGQSGVVVSAELDADGRLLLGGASFATLFAADGSLVRSFGVDGKLVSPALKFGTGAVFTAGADVAMAGVSTAAGGGAAVAAYRTAPQVHVVPTRATTTEGIATWGALTVERTGDTSAELTLPLSVGGTATAGDDYVALPASVTIPAGQTGVRLDVAPIDDAVLEGPETVVLSTAGASGYLLARPSATVTINDNEIADAGEPNEDLDAPSVLTLDRSGLSLGRSLGTAADVDVYALDLTGTGLRVDVVRTAGTDAVELDLFDAARNPVGHSSTGGPAEGVTLAAATTGRYYVRVRHAAAGGGYVRYTLSAGTRGPRFTPPPQVSSTAAVTLPTASFDVGGEGLSAHDTEVTNTGNTDPRPLAGPDFRKYRPTGATADVTVLTDARPGEWLEFTIDAAEAGDYGLVTRAVAAAAGGTFHVEVDGVDATGPLAVPANAAAGAPTQPVTAALSLTAGQHVLRLVMDAPQAGGATVGEFESIEVRPAKPVVRVALPGPAVTREPESPTDGSGLAFKISRAAGPADAPLTVRYAISGTATPGADYVVPSGEVTIPAGAGGFANAIVNLLADYKYEDAETLTLTILPSADYTIAGPASVSYTVNDFHPTPSPYEPNNTPATANNLYG
ncbi:MAG TPA: Calx-beta domain-containing protein, partial [Humisphaera sp.]